MQTLHRAAVVLVLLMNFTSHAAEAKPEAKHPPSNNQWSGFPVGSWTDEEAISTQDGKTTSRRMKLMVTGIAANGAVSMQNFRQSDNHWIREDYASNSGTGARITPAGFLANPDAEQIIFEDGKVQKFVQLAEWKGEKKDDEDLKIGTQTVHCQVWVWTNGTGENQASVTLWRGAKVHVPGHLEFFGHSELTLYPEPDVVQVIWKKGSAAPVTGRADSLDETLKIGDKTIACVTWKTTAAGMNQTYWLSDEIPGRKAKCERRKAGSDQIVGGETVVDFKVGGDPLPPDQVKSKVGAWAGAAMGAWTEQISKNLTSGKSVKSRQTLLGFTPDGYAVLEHMELGDTASGVATTSLDLPPPEVTDMNAKLQTERASTMKVAAAEISCADKTYSGQDQWARPWKVTVGSCPAVTLPERYLDSQLMVIRLGKQTVSLAVDAQRCSIVRRVVDLNDVVQIGGKPVKCVKEEQILRGGENAFQSTFWYSLEVPGGFVKSLQSNPSYDGTPLLSETAVTDFFLGK